MNALASRFPDISGELQNIVDRIVDLLPVANEHYYHPNMRGSWSIKAVLPAIAPELDYAKLEDVADGEGAQAAYREATQRETLPERKTRLESALRQYCARDTMAMVRVLRHFLADAEV